MAGNKAVGVDPTTVAGHTWGMSADGTSLVWYRDDLRVHDNPALTAAVERGGGVVALYVLDEESPGIRPLGGAAKWWLHHSLASLAADLADLGIPLILRLGDAGSQVLEVASSAQADAVFWNRRYGQPEREIDAQLKQRLAGMDVLSESYAASLLFEPWTIQTQAGGHYSVFTPFWKACNQLPPPREPLPRPLPAPTSATPLPSIETLDLDALAPLPQSPDWSIGLGEVWDPGESSALQRLGTFVRGRLSTYGKWRDVPSEAGTSRLSPYLRFGEISPFQIWHATESAVAEGASPDNATRFLTELGWREFAWHTLYHFPQLATQNWRSKFDGFRWPELDEQMLLAWQRGKTGVALVDAGMRELWRTGWMHNRIRMVTASFLTKNLLIDWRIGEEWFWDTLVDADQAINAFNWQWVAGSGADAAPYFRIFNPNLQAAKFDPKGTYIRANVPEWQTPSYPSPVIDLALSRSQALSTYERLEGL